MEIQTGEDIDVEDKIVWGGGRNGTVYTGKWSWFIEIKRRGVGCINEKPVLSAKSGFY